MEELNNSNNIRMSSNNPLSSLETKLTKTLQPKKNNLTKSNNPLNKLITNNTNSKKNKTKKNLLSNPATFLANKSPQPIKEITNNSNNIQNSNSNKNIFSKLFSQKKSNSDSSDSTKPIISKPILSKQTFLTPSSPPIPSPKPSKNIFSNLFSNNSTNLKTTNNGLSLPKPNENNNPIPNILQSTKPSNLDKLKDESKKTFNTLETKIENNSLISSNNPTNSLVKKKPKFLWRVFQVFVILGIFGFFMNKFSPFISSIIDSISFIKTIMAFLNNIIKSASTSLEDNTDSGIKSTEKIIKGEMPLDLSKYAEGSKAKTKSGSSNSGSTVDSTYKNYPSVKNNTPDASDTDNNDSGPQYTNIPPQPDTMNSNIQNKSTKKDGYCFIGEFNGKRSCIKTSKGEDCNSGDVYSTEQLCLNPELRE
jgi:hypothetical protein